MHRRVRRQSGHLIARVRGGQWWSLLFVLGCGTAESQAATAAEAKALDAPFIALQRHFGEVLEWRSVAIPDTGVPFGHTRGESRVYVNRRLPPFGEPAPVGSILVKVVEAERIEDWELHGMVKRGGDFNDEGSIGWEWFDIKLDDRRRSIVTWRGEGNAADPGGYGRALDDTPIGCNDCHVHARGGDYIFTRGRLGPDPREQAPARLVPQ